MIPGFCPTVLFFSTFWGYVTMSSPVKNDPLGGSLPPMASKGKQLTSEPAEAKGNRVDYRLGQRRLGFFLGDCCAVVERVTGVVLLLFLRN